MSDSPARPPVPGFQPASTLPRPSTPPASTSTGSTRVPAVAATAGGSLRNAAGGQPPIPRPRTVTVPGASTYGTDGSSITSIIGEADGDGDGPAGARSGDNDKSTGAEKEKENAVAGPSKPVQRPVTRKNAIVYNAVQVSFSVCLV